MGRDARGWRWARWSLPNGRPMRFSRITSVEIPRYPLLRLTFDNGFGGEVGLSKTIGEGGVMAMLRDPDVFALVRIGDGGRSLGLAHRGRRGGGFLRRRFALPGGGASRARACGPPCGKDDSGGRVNELLPRMVSVSPVIHGVLKIVWTDGYEGVVDLRPLLARGKIFTYLQTPENFEKVRLEEYGHHIYWLDDKGYEIDLSADSLRRDAEKQAELHQVAG